LIVQKGLASVLRGGIKWLEVIFPTRKESRKIHKLYMSTIALDETQTNRFSKRSILIYVIPAVLYALWIVLFVGWRIDHSFFFLFVSSMYFISDITHKFTVGFLFFIIYWILYDSMRVFPNYLFNTIHISQPYDIEKALFGINYLGNIITPNEYYFQNPNDILSVLSGLFYLMWVPLPFAYAMWLFVKDRKMLVYYTFAFLFTNLVGFTIWYSYPAAPPWYIEYFGFEINMQTPGNPALLAEFDRILGIDLFGNMYTKNSNVFAAIPSLHSAYPLVLFYYGLKKKLKIGSIIFFTVMIGIWFAAVYSGHHYIIDVILGAFCAIFAILIFEKLLMKTRFKSYLDKLSDYIKE
jgi:hypothetical protein